MTPSARTLYKVGKSGREKERERGRQPARCLSRAAESSRTAHFNMAKFQWGQQPRHTALALIRTLVLSVENSFSFALVDCVAIAPRCLAVTSEWRESPVIVDVPWNGWFGRRRSLLLAATNSGARYVKRRILPETNFSFPHRSFSPVFFPRRVSRQPRRRCLPD